MGYVKGESTWNCSEFVRPFASSMRKCPWSLAVLDRPLSSKFVFDIFPSRIPEIERNENVLINRTDFEEIKRLNFNVS